MSNPNKNYSIDIGTALNLDIDAPSRKPKEIDRELTPQTNIEININGYIGVYGQRIFRQPFKEKISNYNLKKNSKGTKISISTQTGIRYLIFSDFNQNTNLHSIECKKDDKGDLEAKIKLLEHPQFPIFPNSIIEIKKFNELFWSGVVQNFTVKKNNSLIELTAKGFYQRIKNLKIEPIKYNLTNVKKEGIKYKISYNIANIKYNDIEIKKNYHIILRKIKENEGIYKVDSNLVINQGYVLVDNMLLEKAIGNYTDATIEFIPDIFNCLDSPKPLLMEIFIRFCELYLSQEGLNFIQLNKSKIINKEHFEFKYPNKSKDILNSLRLNKPYAVGDSSVGDFVEIIENLSGNILKIYVSGYSEWVVTETLTPEKTFIENEDLLDVSIEEKTDKLYNEISLRAKVYQENSNDIIGKSIIQRDLPSITLYGKKTLREAFEQATHIDTIKMYVNNFLKTYKKPSIIIKSKKMIPEFNINPATYEIISTQVFQNKKVKIKKWKEKNGINKFVFFDNTAPKNKQTAYQVSNEYKINIDNINYEVEFEITQEDDRSIFSSEYNSLSLFLQNDKIKGNIFKVYIIGRDKTKEALLENKELNYYEAININLNDYDDFYIKKIRLKPLKNNFNAKISSLYINGKFSRVYKISLSNVTYSYSNGIENYKLNFKEISENSKKTIDRLKTRIDFKGYEI